MNDSGRPAVPHPPYDEVRAALGDDPASQARLDALQSELRADRPDPAAVREHAGGLREVEARIANWWDAPETQAWIKAISDAGL